jgi:hypothetical protein
MRHISCQVSDDQPTSTTRAVRELPDSGGGHRGRPDAPQLARTPGRMALPHASHDLGDQATRANTNTGTDG